MSDTLLLKISKNGSLLNNPEVNQHLESRVLLGCFKANFTGNSFPIFPLDGENPWFHESPAKISPPIDQLRVDIALFKYLSFSISFG